MSQKKKGRNSIAMILGAVGLALILGWFSGLIGGISQEEAEEIALAQAADAGKEPTVLSVKEFDDFQVTYDVQVTGNNMIYEFKILARNGNIADQEMDYTGPAQGDDATQGTGAAQTAGQQTDIGVEKAKEIALAEISGAVAGDITSAQADSDDGRLSYEIEIRYDGKEYDFDIDAATGEIISRSEEVR